VVDTAYIQSIRALIGGNDKGAELERRQKWLGFLLLAKTFDPKISQIPDDLLA